MATLSIENLAKELSAATASECSEAEVLKVLMALRQRWRDKGNFAIASESALIKGKNDG